MCSSSCVVLCFYQTKGWQTLANGPVPLFVFVNGVVLTLSHVWSVRYGLWLSSYSNRVKYHPWVLQKVYVKVELNRSILCAKKNFKSMHSFFMLCIFHEFHQVPLSSSQGPLACLAPDTDRLLTPALNTPCVKVLQVHAASGMQPSTSWNIRLEQEPQSRFPTV